MKKLLLLLVVISLLDLDKLQQIILTKGFQNLI